MGFRSFLKLIVVLLFIGAMPVHASGQTKNEVRALLGELPTAFEPNEGQAAKGYTFVARRPELTAAFAPTFADLSVRGNNNSAAHLRLRFIHGAAQAIEGENKLGSKTNYMLGNGPEEWHTGVANYGRLRYRDLYPGIDLVFYGNGEQLEHDFVIAPGADPSRIHFQLEGGNEIHLEPNGDLRLNLRDGELVLRRPSAYQEGKDHAQKIDVAFVLKGSAIGFRVGRYDRSRPLIVDPVMVFSTYLAGGTVEFLNAVTVDGAGNVYVTGFTASPDFPTTPTSFQPTCPTCVPASRQGDAFVSKLDPTGKTLVYSTFLGGSAQDSGSSISVDANGNALVAGITSSLNFPSLNPINPTPPCCNLNLLFVTSLSPDGSALNYSGLVGSISFNTSVSLAADASGNAYIATQTDSVDFPVSAGTFSGIPATNSAHTLIVLKVSPTGSLLYSTAIPGTATPTFDSTTNNFTPAAIAVDASGNAFVAGTAGAGLPATPGVLAGTLPADASFRTAYALKLDATAANLLYATYIPETVFGNALAIDGTGGAYIAGDTNSSKLPVPINAAIPSPNCTGTSCTLGYIVKLNSTATQQVTATYMTGTSTANQFNSVKALALDAAGNVYAVGTTSEPTFPVKDPLQSILQHSVSFSESAFVSELSNDLSTLLFSTFLSGTTGAFPQGVAAGPSGRLIVAGITSDTDFPTTPGVFQSVLPVVSTGFIPQHGFIASIDLATAAASVCLDKPVLNFGGVLVNTSASQTLNVTNCGNADLHVTSLSASSPRFTAAGCTAAVTPGNSCTVTVTYSPIDTTVASASLTITDDAGLSPQIVGLSGLGGFPQVSLPIGIFFGDLPIGTTAATGSVLLQNTGQGALNIANITVSGDYSIQTNGCGTQVLAGNFCLLSLNFSPTLAGSRSGTLTITDNAQGSPHTVPLDGNGLGQLPLPVITRAPAVATNGAGRLSVQGRNFFPNSTLQWNGSARQTTFVSEFSLIAQLTAADLSQIGEAAVTVLNGAPGGGPSNQVFVPVFAPIAVDAQDIVLDPLRNVIYASVGANAVANANSIVVIDPASRQIVNSFAVGNNPDKLAVSDDGQFLYVGLDATSSVAQLALPAGTVNGTAALGSNVFGGFAAGAISVLPGLPHSYVVSVIQPKVSPSFDHALVFDDFTARPNQVSRVASGPTVEADAFTFLGNDATKLYASTVNLFPDSFYRITLDANGLSFIDETQSIAGGLLEGDGTSIFVSNGRVIDPAAKVDKGVFLLSGSSSALKVDVAASRSFFGEFAFAGPFLQRPTAQIEAFDNRSGGLIGQIQFQGQTLSSTLSSMLRWGTDGLALKMSTSLTQNSVVVLRTGLTSRAPAPGFQISGTGVLNGYIPPVTIAAGGSATFNLSFKTDPGFAGQITLSCSGLPAASACTPSPTTLTVPASGSLTTTVTISTTKQVASAAPLNVGWTGTLAFAAMFMFPFGMVLACRDRRRRCHSVLPIGVLLIAGAISGCGGGGGSTPPPPPPPNFTSAGTYNVLFTATSGTVSRQVNLTVIVQ
ncbi:MAG: choice-of-anchor D domain-containing protein [Acidobacteriia bacterium]|nr:choice-of-anchor D domain-containing protein [Terriglobia bacterium]